MMSEPLTKGEAAEELLRDYFSTLGYFAVRGIPYRYGSFDVTDVDIWLYSRPSPLTRERANVDIKRKKTPQALERIFWAKGLQEVLSLERCIVVTTDTRTEVSDFGAANGVLVLDGKFLSSLTKSSALDGSRLSEDELLKAVETDSIGKYGGNLRMHFLASKSRLLTKLNFDGCNEWLADVRFYMEKCIADPHHSTIPLRLLYSSISFLLIGIDFSAHSQIVRDAEFRTTFLDDGFRYGQMGKRRSDDILKVALQIVEAVAQDNSRAANMLKAEINQQLSDIPANVLSEFFAKHHNLKTAVDTARQFQSQAYAAKLKSPTELTSDLQGILGLLCDFHAIDRKKLFSTQAASPISGSE